MPLFQAYQLWQMEKVSNGVENGRLFKFGTQQWEPQASPF